MKNEKQGAAELYLAPEETKNSDEIAQSENASDFEATKKHRKHKRIEEIPNQRGKNLKVFRMNDGTEQAVFSPSSIHVFDDETQTFEDVDCTLTQDKDGKHFTCGKNHFVARFSNEDDNDEIFSIEQGKHKVTVCVGKNPRRKNHFVNPHLHKKDGIRTTDILTFANVEPDTDFEYSVEGNGVKENIVVKKPCESYRYPFALRCENVTARFDERAKRIAFISNESKNEVFFIPAPFMTDANGLTSTAVNFEVKTDDTDLVLLTVTADEDWMNSPERTFPVVIDPQIQLSGSSQMTTYSWNNGQLYPSSLHTIGTIGSSCEVPSDDTCISEPTEEMKSATVIDFNTPMEGTIANCGDEMWYQFVANASDAHLNEGVGKYTVYTDGALDTVGKLYDSTGKEISYNDDSNKLNFSITANLTYSETYYVCVKAYGSNTGSYTLTVTYAQASSENLGTSTDTNTVTCYTSNRMYMDFTMPTLPRNPRIKKAELQFFQYSAATGSNPLFGLYQVTDEIVPGDCTPIYDSDLIDYARMKPGNCEDCSDSEIVSYTFDITTLVDRLNKGESNHSKLVLKLLDESISSQNNITLFGSAYGEEYAPKIVMTYESTYGVNTSYRTHTHELGRFGQGSVDLQCGNLMLESEDFAWAGNRMPVTVKHLFNSALAGYPYTQNNAINLCTTDFSAMQIGLGFKLNLMQSMIFTSFVHDGKHYDGYVYIGENGEETYFKPKDGQDECCNELYEDVNGGDMSYNCISHTLTQGEDTYLFNECGRLVEITDASGNRMEITYASDRITAVTDGAGRRFSFDYTDCGQLISITAPDGTKIAYTYTCALLTGISYPDGKTAEIIYDTSDKPANVILRDANGETVYKVAYTFSGNRLTSVTEYGSDGSMGARSVYSYSVASARTVVTTTELADTDEGDCSENVIRTVYTFDDDGNTISEYVYSEDTGNVGGDGEESGINPHSGDGGAGVVSNINNLLQKHNFESFTAWSRMSANSGNVTVTNYMNESNAKFGKKVLRMQSSNAELCAGGVYQTTNSLPAGQYTFSAYLRVLTSFSGSDAGAYIRVCDTCGNVLGVSEHLSEKDSEYTRLIVPFTLDCEQSVEVQILVNGKGTVYVDAAQLENNPYANAYNMLENGNFERGQVGWAGGAGVSVSTDTCFNMTKSLAISGNVDASRSANQSVVVKRAASTRETFTLSGWAKGWGLPNHEREDCPDSTFRLRAVITYGDGSSQTVTADFSPCTEEWQLASVQFAKEQYKAVNSLRVYCDYGYNSGVAYFDDVQLVRNSIETNLSASDFVVENTEDTEDETAEVVETETTPTFEEAKDKFGNTLTETTFTDGEFGTIYRAFGFAEDGNDLLRETDARGNETQYEVDKKTSRNEEITDRLGNKTAYEYDESGRTTKVTSKNADGAEIATVSYAYDAFDNMTEIARGDGMKYALAYNAFHNLESIGVEGKAEKLIHYTYKNGNGRLKEMKYANGDTMKATYNSIGQMVAETWTDACGVETARYKYVYDGEGNIVRSIDIFAKKEYNYEYEEGKIVRATESDIEIVNNIVTLKVLVNTVRYYYSEDKLTKKVIIPVDGTVQTIFYENNDDNTVVKFSVGNKTVTSHSKTDSFGRKIFDEFQLGSGFISRQFTYHAGQETREHKEQAAIKSSPTTQLVKEILFSDNRTLSYEYDAEERITSVTESYKTADNKTIANKTEYTYDALGQLLTETVNGSVVNSMKYDNYGNIVEKNGKKYLYDATWHDLLKSYDGYEIEYDAQGNPTKYLGHDLTWEKGRQLKSFDSNTYTYNANGIRTSKTVKGVKHNYILDGTKILRETWEDNVLIPMYDEEDAVCGIIYNNVPHYFQKNLQGDIIAIANANGEVEARYTYDAWGAITNISGTDEGISIAVVNPFRYRGYYYDQEIGLYYLIARYYTPNTGRFINGDLPEWTATNHKYISNNLFAYCKNDCVNTEDETGHGGVESLISALSSIIDVLKNILNMIKNSYYRESISLVNSVKRLTKKQRNYLSSIRALNSDVNKIKRYLGWVANALLFATFAVTLGTAYKTGASIDRAILDCGIEYLINTIVDGAGNLFQKVAKYIPYIGFLIGLIGGWLLSYSLKKFFNSKKVNRIKSKFASIIRNVRTTFWNWLVKGVNSLNA